MKREEKEKQEEAQPFDTGPKLDLGFKEGQTIRININVSVTLTSWLLIPTTISLGDLN